MTQDFFVNRDPGREGSRNCIPAVEEGRGNGQERKTERDLWWGDVSHFKFSGPNDISGTAKARMVKFCITVDCIKY